MRRAPIGASAALGRVRPRTGLRRRADNLQPASVAYSDPSGLAKRRYRSQSWPTRGLHLENLGSGRLCDRWQLRTAGTTHDICPMCPSRLIEIDSAPTGSKTTVPSLLGIGAERERHDVK